MFDSGRFPDRQVSSGGNLAAGLDYSRRDYYAVPRDATQVIQEENTRL